MNRSSLMTIRWILPLLAVTILSVPAIGQQVLYDTGFSETVLFNGAPSNLGWTSGNASAAQPQRWSAQPFSLPAGSWTIIQINAEYFVPAAVPTDIGVKIWNRTGEVAPTDSDEVFTTTVPNPGGEGNDIWSELPLGAGVVLGGGDYYLTVYGIGAGGASATLGWFTGAPDGTSFVDTNGDPWMWRASMYPAPGFEFYQLDMSVLAADQGDPAATYSAAFQVIAAGPAVVTPDAFTVTRGEYVSGGLPELAESDNMDLSIRRLGTDTQSRTEFEVMSTSPTDSPISFEFTLEGAVFARSNVIQTIELFDYVAAAWELVDTQDAARSPSPDLVVTVAATGDLSRFVEAGTMSIEARIRYRSESTPRQNFASNTDQTIWTIE